MGCIKLLICVMHRFNLLAVNAPQAGTTKQQQKRQMFHLAYKDKLQCAVLCCAVLHPAVPCCAVLPTMIGNDHVS